MRSLIKNKIVQDILAHHVHLKRIFILFSRVLSPYSFAFTKRVKDVIIFYLISIFLPPTSETVLLRVVLHRRATVPGKNDLLYQRIDPGP